MIIPPYDVCLPLDLVILHQSRQTQKVVMFLAQAACNSWRGSRYGAGICPRPITTASPLPPVVRWYINLLIGAGLEEDGFQPTLPLAMLRYTEYDLSHSTVVLRRRTLMALDRPPPGLPSTVHSLWTETKKVVLHQLLVSRVLSQQALRPC
jgi:hypothetical protein